MYSKQSQSESWRRTETNGGAFLPEDLIFEILPWLPALSLIRFKCVRKSWRDLIENPNFAAKHLRNQNQSSSGKCLLLMRQFSTNSDEVLHRFSLIFFADDGNDTSTVAKFIDFPFSTGDCWLRVSGYCHGIICFSAFTADGYAALANPGIRQFRVLPDTCISFTSTEPKSDFYCYTGFGYDPVSGDYKVVRAWILDDYHVNNNRVEVYTLSTDSWREINNCEPFIQLLILSIEGSGKYFNGAYYWWIEVEEEEEDEENEEIVSYSIIVFDMSKEVFLQIHWPHPYSYSPRETLKNRLSIMNGSLVLVTPKAGTSKSFDIWVITRTEKDGGIGVTKLETIGPLNGVKDVPVFWKNKEILFESWDDLRIVSYKKGASEMKLLPVVLSHSFRLPRDVIAEVYTCSLISIARGE